MRAIAKLFPVWLSVILPSIVYAQDETQPPEELVTMVDKILGLLQYLGIAVLIGGMICTGIQLATADTPEEQARAKKRLGLIILAGAIMAQATLSELNRLPQLFV
ncbi:hypothetical protein CF15_05585 [Pyrodictium occultum]|uniref:Uncharacterized protein n=1 Tax=Pyrodictium occultum TaxID=2309 RepID=A0A0V8RW76_PYROC|nr:TrbC/VirB2 family protein [Pyrodictium occultum]KSW12226.1 hypothetical protein CF15_05585 [Pyrodictium occultum]